MNTIGALALTPGYYFWLAVGALLIVAEMIAPGFFLIWLGGAALMTGVVTAMFGLGLVAQFIAFALSAIALIYIALTYVPYNAGETPDALLNRRAQRLVGQTVRVSEDITFTTGRVKVGDGAWSAKGCMAAIDTEVKVTGVDGNTLIVEPIGATLND